MSIYLGTFGNVELKRQFNDSQIDGTVTISDVDVNRKRFSFNFDPGLLVTGDQVRISNKEDASLSFISGHSGRAVRKFINVDELNGIRLYNSFSDAINGGTTNATTLAAPSASIEIKVIIYSSTFRILSQVRSYELNTQRETVDTTSLSDNFRSQISGLMSGSGRVTCFWEYTGDTEKSCLNTCCSCCYAPKLEADLWDSSILKLEEKLPLMTLLLLIIPFGMKLKVF